MNELILHAYLMVVEELYKENPSVTLSFLNAKKDTPYGWAITTSLGELILINIYRDDPKYVTIKYSFLQTLHNLENPTVRNIFNGPVPLINGEVDTVFLKNILTNIKYFAK